MGPTRYVRTRDRRNMVRRFTDMLPGSRFYGVMRATRDMTGDNSKNRFARSVGMFESPHGAYPLANPTAMTLKDIRALPLGRWEQAKLYQGKRTEELDAQFKKTCPTERNHVWDAPNVTDASAHSAIIRDRTSTLAFIAFSTGRGRQTGKSPALGHPCSNIRPVDGRRRRPHKGANRREYGGCGGRRRRGRVDSPWGTDERRGGKNVVIKSCY